MAKTTKQAESYGWTSSVGRKPTFAWINPDDISVDESYQREGSKFKSHGIARDFEWIKFSCPVVSIREDGGVFCTDGGHRVMAARLRPDIEKIPCLVFKALSVAEEARSFVGIQLNRKAMNGMEVWKAQLIAKDPDVMAAKSIVEDAGYVVCRGSGPDNIQAAQTVLRIYRRGLLEDVLFVIRSAWPDSSVSRTSGFLEGLNRFLAVYLKHDHPITRVKMIRKMKSVDAAVIERRARAHVELGGLSLGNAYRHVFAKIYNHRLLEKRRITIG